MQSIIETDHPATITWKQAMQSWAFKSWLIAGHLLFIVLLFVLPHFFDHIELRDGVPLYDPILILLPSIDLSTPIFICIWGIAALLLYRCFSSPAIMITALYGFLIVLFMRMLTISLVALDPPAGLIPLVDPLSNIAYGKAGFITKDLFFSGHTATMFLIFLCLPKRGDKLLALLATLLVGSMVLIQHVHYSIDVLAAPLFTWCCFWLGREIALSGWYKAAHIALAKEKVRVPVATTELREL
ncbi:phosphatase PAP2-related protein [Olivibacter sp. XZL3]|uniref:phosphatase PAP2-related protein n=1 Tax=Olivibacter sp. XZL3 TaxID=1735116 RepID=UPI0010659154|nr:phosphatase PAP2-related protein [Olivibacter sp. XZL3]